MPEAESETPAAKPKRKSRRRGCLFIALVALVLLVPGFYWFENWSGRRAIEKAMARYEAAGLSLDSAAVLPGEGPPEENFGAIPLLDGIKALLPHRAATSLPPRTKGAKPSKPPPVTELPALTGLTTDWAKVRVFLDVHTPCKPPPDEPSDALAVFLALDAHRAVFDELVAALPRSRRWSLESAGNIPSVVIPLTRLIALRAHAAVACGKLEEVLPLARLLWKFRQAAQSESILIGKLIAHSFEARWCAVAQAMLSAPGVTDSMLAELAAIPPDWSPEQELLHTYRSETAIALVFFKSLRNFPSGSLPQAKYFLEKLKAEPYGPGNVASRRA